MHTQSACIQDSTFKEQVSVCLLLMPLNHSYTHFYQLLWKRGFPAPLSPYFDITALSLSLSLVSLSDWTQQCSLRGSTIYIEEVVKTQRTTSPDHHDRLQCLGQWWYDAPTFSPGYPHIGKRCTISFSITTWASAGASLITAPNGGINTCQDLDTWGISFEHDFVKHDKTAQQMAGSSQ